MLAELLAARARDQASSTSGSAARAADELAAPVTATTTARALREILAAAGPMGAVGLVALGELVALGGHHDPRPARL